MTIKLPNAVKKEIVDETFSCFKCSNSEGLKQYRGVKDSPNDLAVKEFMAELKEQKIRLYGVLSAQFKDQSEEKINEGFTNKSSDIYLYWIALKANASEEPKKQRLRDKLNTVQPIGSMIHEIPLLYRSSILAAMTGGLALYYLRSQPLIATVLGIEMVCYFYIFQQTRSLGLAVDCVDKVSQDVSNVDVTSQQMEEKVQKIFELLKESSYFFRFYLKAQEKASSSGGLLDSFAAAGRAIKGDLEIKGSYDAEKVKTFCKDFSSFVSWYKRYFYSSLALSCAFFSLAYQRKAYPAMIYATIVGTLEFMQGKELRALQVGASCVAAADPDKVSAVYQEKMNQTVLARYMGPVSNSEQIHANVIRMDAILNLFPSWKQGDCI